MSHEWLSSEQAGRYGRFVADPTPEELERFFFLDEAALAEVQTRRGLHNKLGWSVQWGTVRMLGTFLTDSGPVQVPEVVIRYAAEQLGVQEWTAVKQYGNRPQTPYDHATQIRDLLGYREFSAAEGEVAAFIASRVAKTRDSRRELFDRAVLWLSRTGCCCRDQHAVAAGRRGAAGGAGRDQLRAGGRGAAAHARGAGGHADRAGRHEGVGAGVDARAGVTACR